MAVKILIPTVLRSHTGGHDSVDVTGGNIEEVISNLVTVHPGMKQHLMGDNGKVRSFVNIFINEDDIRSKGDMAAPVNAGDEISIVPSIAGGNGAAVTQEKVTDVLSTCYDPEIPVNIVDLGLIYEVRVDDIEGEADKKVYVKMTLTAPGCPEGPKIRNEVTEKVKDMEGVKESEVELVWEPVWTPDRMSEAARLELGMA